MMGDVRYTAKLTDFSGREGGGGSQQFTVAVTIFHW